MIMQTLQSLWSLYQIRHETGRKHKKAQKEKKLVSKKISRKCRLIETRIEQNNDHTRIMC